MTRVAHVWTPVVLAALVVIYVPTAQAQPDPNVIAALQSAGERMEGEAQAIQERAQQMVGRTRRGETLIHDLVDLRTAINQFRTGIDVRADPALVRQRFGRVSKQYRDVRQDLARLGLEERTSIDRKVRRLDQAYQDAAGLMGR
jgi:GTP1/Obg family GTP-binding protein